MTTKTPPTAALNDLSLEKLIGEPLQAAAKAHETMVNTNLKILENLAKKGNQTFTFERAGGTDISVSVPTMALVDLPFFSIDSLTNEFTFEVSSIQATSEEKVGSLSGSASAGGFVSKFVDLKLEAGYNKTNRSSTSDNARGKLNIRVTASKAGYSKGMQTLMDAAVKSITASDPSVLESDG